MTQPRLFNLFLSFTLALAPAMAIADAASSEMSPEQQNAECDKALKNVNACVKATNAARQAGGGVTPGSDGQNAAANAAVEASSQVASASSGAQAVCKKVADACRPVCTEKTKRKAECDRVIAAVGELGASANEATQAGAESAQTAEATGDQGGGAGAGGMDPSAMMGMMGAAAGMLGSMMNKKKNDQKPQMPQMPQQQGQPTDGALLPNGAIDCSKPDAHKYPACNDQLVRDCLRQMESARCAPFSERFCGRAGSVNLGDGGSTPTRGSGEGTGTPYCKTYTAIQFCKQSGRGHCPSCLQLASFNSPACQANPAMCFAQNSPDQINQARQTCPTDPAFSDPSFANSGGGAQIPPELRNDVLNPPILPPQQGSTGSGAGGSGGSAGGGSGSGGVGGGLTFSSASAAQSSALGEGLRESKTTNGGSSGSVGSGGAGSGQKNHGQREASSRRPASDVEAVYGPSLFSVGSQTLRSRCQAGKLLNCP